MTNVLYMFYPGKDKVMVSKKFLKTCNSSM